MTQGLDGKSIVYDGENRPIEVTKGGVTTQYVYGPDGSRTLRVDDAGGTPTTTLYLPQMEIRNVGGTETRIACPYPSLRVVNGTASYLLRNQLDSVVLVTGSNGTEDFERVYQPFGDAFDWTLDPNAVAEDKGFIGQRRDDDAALIYLNARYLDPKLGMFTQPDWMDVRLAGVGVNRFAYTGNDPVNLSDPGGLSFWGDRKDWAKEGHEIGKNRAEISRLTGDRTHYSRQTQTYHSGGSQFAIAGSASHVGPVTQSSIGIGNIGTSTPSYSRGGGFGKIVRAVIAAVGLIDAKEAQNYFYHGTSVKSALTLLNTKMLSIEAATSNNKHGSVGFYLATDPEAAELFSLYNDQPHTILMFSIGDTAFSSLLKSSSVMQSIPQGGLRGPIPAAELYMPTSDFPVFNSHWRSGGISVYPYP